MEGTNPTLLGLPAELRAQILELVTFHADTNGVISPTLIDHEKGLKSSNILIGDVRWELLQNGRPKRFEIDPGVNFWESPAKQAAKRKYKDRIWDSSPNVQNNHFCTLECLLQPPIAMVNKMLRREALPLFYSNNHFHLELSNFHVHSFESQGNCEMTKSPVQWYRAIGNENIKEIERLSLGGFIPTHRLNEFKHHGVLQTYLDPPCQHEGALFCPGRKVWVNLKGVEGGECLRVLEQVVAWCLPHVAELVGTKMGEETQYSALFVYV
jgi:hypothetical protein